MGIVEDIMKQIESLEQQKQAVRTSISQLTEARSFLEREIPLRNNNITTLKDRIQQYTASVRDKQSIWVSYVYQIRNTNKSILTITQEIIKKLQEEAKKMCDQARSSGGSVYVSVGTRFKELFGGDAETYKNLVNKFKSRFNFKNDEDAFVRADEIVDKMRSCAIYIEGIKDCYRGMREAKRAAEDSHKIWQDHAHGIALGVARYNPFAKKEAEENANRQKAVTKAEMSKFASNKVQLVSYLVSLRDLISNGLGIDAIVSYAGGDDTKRARLLCGLRDDIRAVVGARAERSKVPDFEFLENLAVSEGFSVPGLGTTTGLGASVYSLRAWFGSVIRPFKIYVPEREYHLWQKAPGLEYDVDVSLVWGE